ncbi:MAG: intra-flagellar transport protein 57-domain-containing protein, partial [Olpidium bornovanus]
NSPRNGANAKTPRPTAETKPKADPTEWRLEVERVTPHLRVVIPNDNKDWRIHLEQMRMHEAGIESALSTSSAQLSKLHADIERTLEKISSREKYVNNQFEAQIEEYRVCQEKLSEIKQRHNKADTHVTELTNELSRVSEELDHIKVRKEGKMRARSVRRAFSPYLYLAINNFAPSTTASPLLHRHTTPFPQTHVIHFDLPLQAQMDEIGSGMTDSKPLVNIKQGLVRLKVGGRPHHQRRRVFRAASLLTISRRCREQTEIKQMDLRIGVIEHTLLTARLRSKGNLGDALRMNANQGVSVFASRQVVALSMRRFFEGCLPEKLGLTTVLPCFPSIIYSIVDTLLCPYTEWTMVHQSTWRRGCPHSELKKGAGSSGERGWWGKWCFESMFNAWARWHHRGLRITCCLRWHACNRCKLINVAHTA